MMFYLCVLLLAFTSIDAQQEEERREVRTRCRCTAKIFNGSIEGEIVFFQYRNTGDFSINVQLTGVKPGIHGIHVHEKGDLGNECQNTGGHYNPENKKHGCPIGEGNNRHKGDLGNLEFQSNGPVQIIRVYPDSKTTVKDFVGRAVVLHEDRDDCGRGNYPDSKINGHSGKRIACGLITNYQCEVVEMVIEDNHKDENFLNVDAGDIHIGI